MVCPTPLSSFCFIPNALPSYSQFNSMGMRLLTTDWTERCTIVGNKFRLYVCCKLSCLAIHPSITRKRGESILSAEWIQVLGRRGPVAVRDSKHYHKQVVLCRCPLLSSPILPPTILTLPSPPDIHLTTTACDSFTFCQECINPLPTKAR